MRQVVSMGEMMTDQVNAVTEKTRLKDVEALQTMAIRTLSIF